MTIQTRCAQGADTRDNRSLRPVARDLRRERNLISTTTRRILKYSLAKLSIFFLAENFNSSPFDRIRRDTPCIGTSVAGISIYTLAEKAGRNHREGERDGTARTPSPTVNCERSIIDGSVKENFPESRRSLSRIPVYFQIHISARR